jgi:uncharacterized protein YlaN (UPF0358 family)
MNNKQRFDFYVQNGMVSADSDLERVRLLVNALLDNLYKPNIGDSEFVLDTQRAEYYGVDVSEPVNWGGMVSCSVDRDGLGYLVAIEEASPDNCPTLCAYVTLFMNAWGWDDITVVTEW